MPTLPSASLRLPAYALLVGASVVLVGVRALEGPRVLQWAGLAAGLVGLGLLAWARSRDRAG
jgi:hypothetical protein